MRIAGSGFYNKKKRSRLIWAAAGCSIYQITGGLSTGLAEVLSGGQSAAIYDVCIKTMGSVGVALAMIGVI